MRPVTAATLAGGVALAFLFAGAGKLLALAARRFGRAAARSPGSALPRCIGRAPPPSASASRWASASPCWSRWPASAAASARSLAATSRPRPRPVHARHSGGEEARFRALAAHLPGAELRLVPSLRGSVTALNGQPVSALKAIPEGAWILRGDRGLTFARDLPEGNEVVEGRWWPADYAGPPLVSLDIEAARALNLKIGDTMTIAVLGSPIEARIASLPDHRLAQLRLQLRDHLRARHAGAGALHADGDRLARARRVHPRVRAGARRRPADGQHHPGQRRGGAGHHHPRRAGQCHPPRHLVAILIGVTVLAGAVAATRRTRARESVLLKLVGATRGQVLAAQGIEFAAMAGGIVTLAFADRHPAAYASSPGCSNCPSSPTGRAFCAAAGGHGGRRLTALLAAWPALRARPAPRFGPSDPR
jgi:putative ABC transport system permease protein